MHSPRTAGCLHCKVLAPNRSAYHNLTLSACSDPTPLPLQAGCQTASRLLSTIAIQTEGEDCGDDVGVEQEGSDEGGSIEEASPDLEGGRHVHT